MIVLFTDFGRQGPYVGQMTAVLRRSAPHIDVVDLFADAPSRDPKAAAYLLAAYVAEFPLGTVFLCVVDPGVGGDRLPAVVWADGRWFVGPENGLFELIIRRARQPVRWWHITWRPEHLSASFHGRDLFAPVAAQLARDEVPPGREHAIEDISRGDWPDDLSQVVYVDVYGNCMTGVRASVVPARADVIVAGRRLQRSETFSRVEPGAVFWYENANGLIEMAVNMGNAAHSLSIEVGSRVDISGVRQN